MCTSLAAPEQGSGCSENESCECASSVERTRCAWPSLSSTRMHLQTNAPRAKWRDAPLSSAPTFGGMLVVTLGIFGLTAYLLRMGAPRKMSKMTAALPRGHDAPKSYGHVARGHAHGRDVRGHHADGHGVHGHDTHLPSRHVQCFEGSRPHLSSIHFGN